MKVAISVNNNSLHGKLDFHFGRCAYFAIVDTRTKKVEFIENPYQNQESGIGKKVSQFLNNLDVSRVIGFQFGVKIKEEFDHFKIQLIAVQDTEKSVQDFLNMLTNH